MERGKEGEERKGREGGMEGKRKRGRKGASSVCRCPLR